MISLQNAISTVLEHCKNIQQTEIVPLWESLGRVLATDVASDINMPPFNKSAVDGFACRKSDIHIDLRIIETVAAGQFPTMEVTKGTCTKIMTGAPVPKGADCVLMVEDTEMVNNNHVRYTRNETKTNIAYFAEDVKEGDTVLKKGTFLEPQHIAILSSVGVANIEVAIKPTVSILVTGDELVETEQKPGLGQIRNSNGHQLVAQVIRAGAKPHYEGIIEDTKQATLNAVSKALSQSNIVVLTGGVSMGDFDYVPGVLQELGVNILFQTMAVQPGKPTVFGVKGEKLIFGLPGNPVSSLFQFDLLVRTAILRLMGSNKPVREIVKVPIANNFSRKRSARLALVPAIINASGEVEPVSYHGSAHINAMATATKIIIVPIGTDTIKKGELVDVRSI
ncbi:MAG TPA: molybdopterin molybdotransferase MoeA [Tenuifilaceae bacterium]|nr:molybdopterin molybdotransferase MoeA [Tenuifilaceae bacterium]